MNVSSPRARTYSPTQGGADCPPPSLVTLARSGARGCDRFAPLVGRFVHSWLEGGAQRVDDALLVCGLELREERQCQRPAGEVLSNGTDPLSEAVGRAHIG